ncbi:MULTISPECIES: hypothetical protein [Alphaproteobacteria]|uniref:hypothetical protein n=1 Tax=Sphingopyxis sp. TaxID=1908224 RepID=UPI0040338612
MYQYLNAFINRSGDALPGYFARLYDSDGNQVDIFADDNGTPIATISGVANAALSDENGMFRWFVANGTYDMRFYDANDVFVSVETGVPMVNAASVVLDLSAETGATLVGTPTGTVQDDIDARPTTAVLAAPTGGEMVGLTDDQNVRGRLVETKSVGDDGAAPAAADNGPTIATVFDEQKQSTSISYNPTSIPMDPRKSIQIAGQYVIKNLVNLWAKTSAVAMNWLNSGLTLAADATDDTIFQFGGSTGLPAWGNQNNIIGGAYNILKADGALVRKNPDFPRYFNDPGGSFMTNWSLTDVSFAGPYGVMLGDVYSQQALIQNFHCVGTVEQILSVQGHFITIENLDKTGFTGSTTEPLMVLGDPDNINPTTNITCNRVILDLNGNVNKDSVHVINAKNTLFDEYYNELTAFKTMLKVEDSYGTRSVRSMFVTALTSGVIELDNSDLHMDAFEPTTSTGKWWDFFTRTNKSPLRIDRLRQFYSAGLPLDEDITVKEIQNVGGGEPMIDVPFMNPVGNCCGNPGFVDGLTGWSIDGSLTATLVAGNKFVPGGKILRLTVASDTGGVKYITQSLAGMAGAEFDGRPMTMIMIGEVTGTAGDSFMGPAETGLGVNQGRLYGGQGLVEVGAVIVGSDGVAYFHVTNPKAGAQYDIHYLSAQFGRQMTPVLPIPMQPLVADPTGGATVDAESRTAIASIINSLQAAGIMRTTT